MIQFSVFQVFPFLYVFLFETLLLFVVLSEANEANAFRRRLVELHEEERHRRSPQGIQGTGIQPRKRKKVQVEPRVCPFFSFLLSFLKFFLNVVGCLELDLILDVSISY